MFPADLLIWAAVIALPVLVVALVLAVREQRRADRDGRGPTDHHPPDG